PTWNVMSQRVRLVCMDTPSHSRVQPCFRCGQPPKIPPSGEGGSAEGGVPRRCRSTAAAPTKGAESLRQGAGGRRASRFRGLRKGEASGTLGSGRDGGGTGRAFSGKTVATGPAGG